MKKQILWITQTAAMLALLVVLQALTKPLGQIVTGSCVNAVLAVSVLLGGPSCGLTVALASPFCAFLLDIGPQLLPIIPAIALGNAAYVCLLRFVYRKAIVCRILSLFTASAGKSAVLYLLVVQLLCRVLPLKQPQIDTFTAMFSAPQLLTALFGGAVAIAIVPVLRKALKKP